MSSEEGRLPKSLVSSLARLRGNGFCRPLLLHQATIKEQHLAEADTLS